MSEINIIIKPREYFRKCIGSAALNQNVELNEELEFYVVNLMYEFITPKKIEANGNILDSVETPLALMYKEAVVAHPDDSIEIFKFLADTSLYISGFFQDYFNRKAFDVKYYMDLGADAYYNASKLLASKSEENLSIIYENMANKYIVIAEILAEVSESVGDNGSTNLLSLYERWTHTNSTRIQKKLEEEGIIPIYSNLRKAQ